MAEYAGKVVVVTGGGRGIGAAIAWRFAAAGARVAVVSRSGASCGATADAINGAHPGAARAYPVGVADHDGVQAAGKRIVDEFGGVNVLVNNAGITRDGLLLRMKGEDWDAVLDTNLKGAFNTVKAFQRALMRAADPRIINIASVVGLVGNPGQANYCASKAGLIGLTKAVARELAGRAVTCNAVAPGFITTDMTGELNDQQRAAILARIPLGEFGTADDVAAVVLFLASPAARYLTGQVIAVDGGMAM